MIWCTKNRLIAGTIKENKLKYLSYKKIIKMKKVIILLIAITVSFGSFAQKAKANSDANKRGTVISTYSCPMHSDEVSDKPAKCSRCGMDLTHTKKEQMKMNVMKIYTCPMHPDVTSDKAGKCAKCGMDMKETKKIAQTYSCPMHPDVISDKPGKCVKCGKSLALSPKEQMKMKVMKTYTCPMHSDVASDKSGKCPKCGMAMVEKTTKKG